MLADVIGATTETDFGETISLLQTDVGTARRRINIKAILTTPTENAADTWTFRLYIGTSAGVEIWNSGAIDAAVDGTFAVDGWFQVRTTGAPGTFISQINSHISVGDATDGTGILGAITTTGAVVLTMTGECSSNNAANDAILVEFSAVVWDA